MVNTPTYSTGSWLGIIRRGTVIVLAAETDPRIVRQLWNYLGDEPSIHGVLNEVTNAFGTGLTSLPDFAILVQGDRLHAILRGDITLVIRHAGGGEEVSGRDVTTWSERSLPLPEALRLTLIEPAALHDFVMELPVGNAVVRLQSFQLGELLAPADENLAPYDAVAASVGAVGDATALPADPFPAVMDDAGLPNPASAMAAQLGQEGIAAALSAVSLQKGPDMESEQTPLEAPVVSPEQAFQGAAFYGAVPDDVEPYAVAPADALADESAEVVGAEEEEDAYAGFAMVADAEWNAQLASVVAPVVVETDLNLTIRPDDSEEDLLALENAESQNLEQDHEQGLEPDAANPLADDAAVEDMEEDGFTTNYDHLFGPTVARSVEGAAVRLDENGQLLPAEGTDSAVPPLPLVPPMAGTAEAPHNSPEIQAPAPWQPTDLMAGDSAADSAVIDSALIDSVPWGHAPGAEDALAPAEPAYDPDHDGQTVMRSEFGQPLAPVQVESRPPTGPMVLARMCPNGHANPPSRSTCSDCGAAINSEPREVGRPRLGTMHVSSGEVVELDHSLIIGRQPSVSRVMGGAMPRLVQVSSGNGDISRSHVEVRLDGWDVLLVDLKATNGTVLVREGQTPRRLSQGEEAILLNGDIAELGDGVSLLFEGLL